MDKVDVSVVIATYNPSLERLFYTIDSVLKQTGVDMEIVLSDDGSKENFFSEVRQFVSTRSNCKCVFIEHDHNQGTVKNILDAVRHSRGKYVRTLGTGDAIYGTETLKDHVEFLKNSNRKWSFGQMIYFSVDENGNRFFVKHKARPQITKTYLSQNDRKCIRQYCALKDIATGTAILYDRATFMHYLELIEDKVVYCEDYTCEIMMFDDIVAAYYPRPVVLYEFASGGISDPKRDEWVKKIAQDITTADRIMVSRNELPQDSLRASIRRIINRRDKLGRKKIYILFEPRKLVFALKHRLFPVTTEVPHDDSCLQSIDITQY